MGMTLGDITSNFLSVVTDPVTIEFCPPHGDVGKSVYVNDGFERSYGSTADQAIGQSRCIIHPAEYWDGISASLKSAQSSRAVARNLTRLTDLPVQLWDETLSTSEALEGVSAKKAAQMKADGRLDAIAASLIMKGCCDEMRA